MDIMAVYYSNNHFKCERVLVFMFRFCSLNWSHKSSSVAAAVKNILSAAFVPLVDSSCAIRVFVILLWSAEASVVDKGLKFEGN